MGSNRKWCCICGELFVPHPRTAEIQEVCFKESCRKARAQRNFQRWVKFNPNYQSGRKTKLRAWARAYPNYRRLKALSSFRAGSITVTIILIMSGETTSGAP